MLIIFLNSQKRQKFPYIVYKAYIMKILLYVNSVIAQVVGAINYIQCSLYSLKHQTYLRNTLISYLRCESCHKFRKQHKLKDVLDLVQELRVNYLNR